MKKKKNILAQLMQIYYNTKSNLQEKSFLCLTRKELSVNIFFIHKGGIRMEKETMKQVVKQINRKIVHYREELEYYLEKKYTDIHMYNSSAAVTLDNMWIEKNEIIIAMLLLIKREFKKNGASYEVLKVQGYKLNDAWVYQELNKTLKCLRELFGITFNIKEEEDKIYIFL